MPKPILRIRLGSYQTREGGIAHITRIADNRAYGHRDGSSDTTWWYADTGEHGAYAEDDLLLLKTDKPSPMPQQTE